MKTKKKKNSDVKDAILEAKQLMEVAKANASEAIAETFRPQLQSMISRTIAEEGDDMWDDEEDGDMYEEEEVDMDDMSDEVEDVEDELEDIEDLPEGDDYEDDEDMEDMDDEIMMDEEETDMEFDDEMEDEDELDLEATIRELQSDLNEEDDMEDIEDMDDMEDDEDMDYDLEESEITEAEIDEIFARIKEEIGGDELDDAIPQDDTMEIEELRNEVADLRQQVADLQEANRIKSESIKETTLLNNKLLYMNKLFNNFALTKEQKEKIIDKLDLAESVRDIKLVYATLVESFTMNTNGSKKTLRTEGKASRGIKSTKSLTEAKDNTIVENPELQEQINRFKQLAKIPSKK